MSEQQKLNITLAPSLTNCPDCFVYLAHDYLALHDTKLDLAFLFNTGLKQVLDNFGASEGQVYRLQKSDHFWCMDNTFAYEDPRLADLKNTTEQLLDESGVQKFIEMYSKAFANFDSVQMFGAVSSYLFTPGIFGYKIADPETFGYLAGIYSNFYFRNFLARNGITPSHKLGRAELLLLKAFCQPGQLENINRYFQLHNEMIKDPNAQTIKGLLDYFFYRATVEGMIVRPFHWGVLSEFISAFGSSGIKTFLSLRETPSPLNSSLLIELGELGDLHIKNNLTFEKAQFRFISQEELGSTGVNKIRVQFLNLKVNAEIYEDGKIIQSKDIFFNEKVEVDFSVNLLPDDFKDVKFKSPSHYGSNAKYALMKLSNETFKTKSGGIAVIGFDEILRYCVGASNLSYSAWVLENQKS